MPQSPELKTKIMATSVMLPRIYVDEDTARSILLHADDGMEISSLSCSRIRSLSYVRVLFILLHSTYTYIWTSDSVECISFRLMLKVMSGILLLTLCFVERQEAFA